MKKTLCCCTTVTSIPWLVSPDGGVVSDSPELLLTQNKQSQCAPRHFHVKLSVEAGAMLVFGADSFLLPCVVRPVEAWLRGLWSRPEAWPLLLQAQWNSLEPRLQEQSTRPEARLPLL